MKQPYTVHERKWTTDGKKKSSFEYSINESSGLPSYICKDHQRKAIRAKNKTEATMLILELIKNLELEISDSSSNDSFGSYTKNYMLDGKCHYQRYIQSEAKTLAPSYMKEYRRLYIAHIAPDTLLCNKRISRLSRVDLILFRERIVQKLGPTSVSRKVFKIVKQNLNYAAMMGDIPFNPSAGMSDIKEDKRERGILTMDEIRLLFPSGELGPWGDKQDYLAFFLAYSCGLRKGEVLGLKWEKLDLEKGAIRIDEAFHSAEGKIGKTKKGVKRWCPIPEPTKLLLQSWKISSRCPNQNDFVFCYQKRFRDNMIGDNFSATWWQKRFTKALDNVEIDRVSRNIVPHSLRHSLNTHLQDKGYSKEKIRETLGWSSEVVQAIYTHADMMDHSGQAQIITEIISK